jgi:hypothetical protein
MKGDMAEGVLSSFCMRATITVDGELDDDAGALAAAEGGPE